jgi:hypothetical protein
VSFVGYADGEVQQFDVAGQEGARTKTLNELNPNDELAITATPQGSGGASAFTRAIAFESSFLDANQFLPTTAIVRRAADFFIFENATDANTIEDLTVENFEIINVFTLGSRGATDLPSDPPLLVPVPEPTQILEPLLASSTQLINAELELQIPQEKTVEVVIYRVFYEDENLNGQADATELPDADNVIGSEVVDSSQSNDQLDVDRGTRIRIQALQTETGGSPTAEDVQDLKSGYRYFRHSR